MDIDAEAQPGRLHAAIGHVAESSNHASWGLQELMSQAFGKELVWYLLDGMTAGAQIHEARNLVNSTATAWVPAPAREAEFRGMARALLDMHEALNQRRNRVVHDIWIPSPTEDQPDRVIGRPATRYAPAATCATLSTFREIGHLHFLAACAHQQIALSIGALRSQSATSLDERLDNPVREARSYFRQLERRHRLLKTHPLWLWVQGTDLDVIQDPPHPGPMVGFDHEDPRLNVMPSTDPVE